MDALGITLPLAIVRMRSLSAPIRVPEWRGGSLPAGRRDRPDSSADIKHRLGRVNNRG